MEPSLSTIKRLFVLSNNRCAFPDCSSPIVEDSGTVTGLVCHIAARSKGGPRYDAKQTGEQRHSFPNLILMCGRHSKVIDSEPRLYTVEVLYRIKVAHERQGGIELSQADARKAELLLRDYRTIYITAGGHVMFHSPGSVQAESVVIKNQKKTIKILPPEGTIGSDVSRCTYAKHLIDRYNQFASQQPGRKFTFAAIYAAIKKRFGAKWDMVRLQQFDALTSFLQQRIDKTRQGSINRGKRIRNYSTYDEYLKKY
jgi:hypothetical protein